jgi:FdhD protein
MADDANVTEVWRWYHGRPFSRSDDELAEESPLEIRVRGRPIAVTMRTPGHDEELAIGFLLSEGVIKGAGDVVAVEPCPREDASMVNVTLAPEVQVDFARLTRHVFASSSCGVCGKATLEAIKQSFGPVADTLRVNAKALATLPDMMKRMQAVFSRTGGLHAAALFDSAGRTLELREDVGRHNAVDKVLGWALREPGVYTADTLLLVSGRASFEIVQKAIAAGIQLVAAISAPSTLAADLARSAGLTLVGFLKWDRFNVYTHRHRILTESFQT